MYINKLKRQLSAPGYVPPPLEVPHEHRAVIVAELPPVQGFSPPPVGQPVVAPPSAGLSGPPGVWSPPGQVLPGKPAKPPTSGNGKAANQQLPNGIDPAAYNSMFGEPTQPMDLESDKLPSALTGTSYSKTTKGDMAAGILVIIFTIGLAILATICYRRRKAKKRQNANGKVPKAKLVDVEAIVSEAEGGGPFRVKTEMQEVKEPEKPESAYGSFQTHRNGRQKSHPIYSLRNPRPNIRKVGNTSRPGTPTSPANPNPRVSPAKERYYYRDQCRRKLFKNIGSSNSSSSRAQE
ncbi:hypothetical protein TWF730_001347 [Orbilia blumenaviensis]|uniref:Uncharacterized protein n=1 Tax=Orbilia blumenaviensis TaxID=1796055 RepID=A0AAV9UJD1_9PEZI